MKTREEAAEWLNHFFKHECDKGFVVKPIPDKRVRWKTDAGQKTPWHFGKVELRMFLDFLYDGHPTSPEQEIK